MVHSKSTWWGTIPPVGITGGQPVEEIRRRTPAPFLSEGEKETTWRERTANGYGELKLPLPVLIPTRSNQRGSTAYHRGSTARAEVPHRGGSTAQPGGSKKLLLRGDGSTVSSRRCMFRAHEKLDLCTKHSEPTRHHKTTQHIKPERHTTNEPTTRHHLSKREGGGRSHLCLSQLVWHREELSLGP